MPTLGVHQQVAQRTDRLMAQLNCEWGSIPHLSTKNNKYEKSNNNIISNVCTTIVWNMEMGGAYGTKLC